MKRPCCLCLALIVVGCSSSPFAASSPGAPGRADRRTVKVDGINWNYTVYKPSPSAKNAPVLIALHGRGGRGEGFVARVGLPALAQEKRFILIAPDAQNGQWHDIDGNPQQKDDLDFFSSLLDAVPSLGGDPNRVYVTGFSNGGGMTFLLGAYFSNRIAAVAGGGASVGALDPELNYHGLPDPKRPIPCLMFHGMADNVNGYDMRTFTLSQPDAARWWAKRIGAYTTPRHQERGNGEVLIDTFQANGNAKVVLMSYKRLGHEWPSDDDARLHENFNDELWNFLSEYRLNAPALSQQEQQGNE